MIFILPFLLKSFQFISLLSQRRLQVQVASIMGQLKGTVVRLQRRRGQESDLMRTQPECQTQRQLWSETEFYACQHTSRARLARNNSDPGPFGSLMPLISLLSLSDSVSTHTMILQRYDLSWLACHQLIVVKEMRNAFNQPPPVTSKLQILTYF